MERRFCVGSEEEMLALGQRLGKRLRRGAFVALYGDLGAGKSVLVRGAASALGIDSVSSPTYTIVQEYPSDPPLFHFDAYRLSDADELYAIGFDDYLNRNGILFIEWANLVPECLPKKRLDVLIEGSGLAPRSVRILPYGTEYEELIESL